MFIFKAKLFGRLKRAQAKKEEFDLQKKQETEIKASYHEIKSVVKEKLEILRRYRELKAVIFKMWSNVFFFVDLCQGMRRLLRVLF
jgi:hypothetical protein